MNVRLAHEGLMLGDIQKRNLKVHELADAVRNGTIGKPAQTAAPAEGDDVGVSIGNKQYHYHYQTTQAAQANTTTAPEAAPMASGSSTLAKVAAGAALLGAGGIGTVGLGLAIDYLTKPSPPAVTQPIDTDTDTNSKLRFED